MIDRIFEWTFEQSNQRLLCALAGWIVFIWCVCVLLAWYTRGV